MQHLSKYPAYRQGKKLIIRLDPSSLTTCNCAKYFEYNNLMGMIKRTPSVPTEYGQAVHILAADLQRGVGYKLASKRAMEYFLNSNCVKDDWRNEGHLMKTLLAYAKQYQNDQFKAEQRVVKVKGENGIEHEELDYAVELPFALPFMVTEHCEVLLCGVIDSIGTLNGTKCIKDIKTTAKWNAQRFIEQYRRSVQFKIYTWALKQMGWHHGYAPLIIDLVFLTTEPPHVRLERSQFIDFTEEEISDTMKWVYAKARELCDAVESGTFLKNTTCCNLYEDGCDFKGVCWGTKEMKEWEAKKLVQRVYDPQKFGEKPVIWEPTT